MSAAARPGGTPAFRAVIFDMDGVVTRTARLHAAAWKELFDQYLEERTRRGLPAFRPFDPQADYLAYVDGKPRYEGVKSFLAARGIRLPFGDPGDGPEAETVCGLGNRKDALFEKRLRAGRVETYASTVALIEALRAAGVAVAVVTASRHGREVLRSVQLEGLFDAIIDGVEAAARELPGKPDPATFRAAAERLGVLPAEAVVVEDAAAGVLAGDRGGFGLVVGVDRGGNREALMRSGADVVVPDLGELSVAALDARFREQARARAAGPATLEEAWHVEQEGFDPAREREMESLFTVGNGYLGVRGALDTPLPASQANLFVAGIYDRKHTELPYSELEFMTVGRGDYAYSELVSLPFPFRLRIAVDGQALDMVQGPWRSLRRVLDLRTGRVHLHYLFQDEQGRRTTLETWRAASAADPHLLMQEVRVTCENFDALIEIDGSLHHPELAEHHPHVVPAEPERLDGGELRVYDTRASGFRVAIATRMRLDGEPKDAVYVQAAGKACVPLRWRRFVAIYTSRDGGDPAARARAHLRAHAWEDFEALCAAHEARWAEHWRAADVRVGGSAPTTQALRFNAYHLRIAASGDPKVSIGARTLSGRAYEGHVFWDVEVFMLPFFLHTHPDLARALLLYRYHTLDGARRRAAELGYRGACYAWESTVTGADVTPRQIVLKTSGKVIPIYTGFEQVHVTADVAYGICRYVEATGDEAFLAEAGAEILFETARFWTSRCTRAGDVYHINAVTGPDEYHHTVDDNAYTNWMARFNLEQAARAWRWLAQYHPDRWQALCGRLELTEDDPAEWDAVAAKLYCPEPDETRPIEQFRGYFERRDYRVRPEERFHPPLRRLFEAEAVNASQLIKQADVLMLPYLFPERFSDRALAVNYDYYEPRTDHGSSLSPPVHAALAMRLGRQAEALEYWRHSLWLDLSNAMGNSALGVHAATMGGTWSTLVFGFLGVRLGAEGPRFDPEAVRTPPNWQTVELTLRYRGCDYPLRWSREEEA
ncbi:MAG TPA: HAD-IA family hydrolase [Burkholderiales bacterium]